MNLTALSLGVFLVAFAGYMLSDPVNRARSWVPVEEWERNPSAAEEKQRFRTMIYAGAVGITGLLFVVLGLAL
ncbi:hypothetical protein [Halobacterium sp. KA-6]|uniref:hypothetical protein n=1 Tax=Halobacterium sp. KA-6 TaxID=2896368 RepID=UPI001E55B791|nr:hypothetical protein [Halobacterium sp. KA-6]MCD2205065.1 hypothetical protein [Halobacterium sp. KA-6]